MFAVNGRTFGVLPPATPRVAILKLSIPTPLVQTYHWYFIPQLVNLTMWPRSESLAFHHLVSQPLVVASLWSIIIDIPCLRKATLHCDFEHNS